MNDKNRITIVLPLQQRKNYMSFEERILPRDLIPAFLHQPQKQKHSSVKTTLQHDKRNLVFQSGVIFGSFQKSGLSFIRHHFWCVF